MTSQQPTEEQIKAYEEELSRITSAQIAVQAAASLLSIGGHRLGYGEGHEQQRDLNQVRDAIDGVRALMPIVERRLAAAEARQLREALSQLQMGYAQLVQADSPQAGGADQPNADASEQAPEGERSSTQQPQEDSKQGPGPAESSGRLWVPGR